MYLYDLPAHKKNVPDLIKDPVSLIKDVRVLVEKHCKDKPELAVTGESVLKPSSEYVQSYQMYDRAKMIQLIENENSLHANDKSEEKIPLNNGFSISEDFSNNCSKVSSTEDAQMEENQNFATPPSTKSFSYTTPTKKCSETASSNSGQPSTPMLINNSQPRRRRTRCKACEACQRSDCGECSFCLDMVKFGGPGRAKQTCMMRQCLSPMLPVTAQCVYCHLDGWRQTPVSPQTKLQTSMEGPSSLMECSVCFEIAHPDCAQIKAQNAKGIVNEDLPNSWECPSCCRSGKNTDYKPRHFRARQKSSEIRRMSSNSDASTATENKIQTEIKSEPLNESEMNLLSVSIKREIKKEIKREHGKYQTTDKEDDSEDDNKDFEYTSYSNVKRHKSKEGKIATCSTTHNSVDTIEPNIKRKKATVRNSHSTTSNTSQRAPKKSQLARQGTQSSNSKDSNLILDPAYLKLIFRHLSQETLITTCSLVCKTWSTVSVDPSLWKCMNCSEMKLSASLLKGIVRRQPEHLILDWTQIVKRQLAWIICKLPGLRNLSLQSIPFQAVQALHTCLCPPLQMLDLSFVRGLNDVAIREILSPPKDARPGLSDSKSRLRNLKILKVAGTDISDVAVRYITQGLPSLLQLDLSSCQRITDAGAAQIGTCSSAIHTLSELNLNSCRLLTELSLDYLSKCNGLVGLDLRNIPQISAQAVINFAATSKHDLLVKESKLIILKK